MFDDVAKTRALDIPHAAEMDLNAMELLRVWTSPNKPQQLVLKPTWEDPAAWGLMLVDVARHAAEAYSREGHDRVQVLARIKQALDAEWDYPTDTVTTNE